VIVALWIFIGLLIVLSAGLWYAETHGIFLRAPGHRAPLPTWPTDPTTSLAG
jgi:hypothetical protein